MHTSETFVPVHVGTSPYGVEYVAYSADKVEPLRASLARAWERHNAKRAARVSALSDGVMDAVAFGVATYAEEGGDITRVRMGRTYIQAPVIVLEWVAETIEREADLIEIGMGGMAETSTRDVSDAFARVCDRRRVRSMRGHAARIKRAARNAS
jgi:hypothetical protein